MVPNIRVLNARLRDVHLPTHGFELVTQKTQLKYSDFIENTNQVIEQVYYKEIAGLIKQTMGASIVKPFSSLIRSSKMPAHSINNKLGHPASVVHSDYTVRSALKLFETFADSNCRKGRFALINAWRSISDDYIICNHHLAMCDPRSVVTPDDFVTIDTHHLN